ncbi:MAG: transcriptional regulator FeaR [Pseudomonas sp.]|nr:transcriptional regulator FeaR [Pseudomonas sp.]
MSMHHAAQGSLEHWTDTMRAICGHFDTQLAFNRSLFIGEISTWSRAGLLLANMRTNAGNIVRQGHNADHDNDQHCYLVSQRTGFSQITQNGVCLQLAPGDMLLMDSVGACEITPFGLIEHASLSLSRAQVMRELDTDSPFGKISSTSACGRVLHLMMDQLCKETELDDDAEGRALQNAFVSLLPAAFERNDTQACDPALLNGANLRSYAQKVIDESLTQPGLNPAGLASRLNISVRHLYRLFEEQGDSVCRYIQRSRLQRSADDLANPIFKGESITAIAYKWGFTDSAHFSRSFKKQFERSPKDFRVGSQQ